VPRPILSFDTSAINALHRDAKFSVPLIAGVTSSYFVRLNGTVVDEVIACQSGREREELRRLCRRMLVEGRGDVLLPFHEITRKVALAFDGGRSLDFRRIDVGSKDYERFIRQSDVSEYEDIFGDQRRAAERVNAQFEKLFFSPRLGIQKLFADSEVPRVVSAAELLKSYQIAGGFYWTTAIGLHERASGRKVDEQTIGKLVESNAPFRALMAAIVVSLYHRCVLEEPPTLAGRSDVFMAVYLPFCDEFISNDHAQQTALREIVTLAGLPTKIRWYKEFADSFSLSVAGHPAREA